jgi:endogenous inhibitor of DNA gyrase (YacG/DUF329 family)
MSSSNEVKMAQFAVPKCPVCGAPRVQKHRPFCSRRCSELDLGRWFTGAYAIPSEELPDEEEFPSMPAPRDGDTG